MSAPLGNGNVARLEEARREISELKPRVSDLEGDVARMSVDLAVIRANSDTMREDLAEIKKMGAERDERELERAKEAHRLKRADLGVMALAASGIVAALITAISAGGG